MRAQTACGSFLDPRTKILIWLLANVVVFTWAPAVFRIAVMLAYFGLFLLERKGKMLAGLLLTYLAVLTIQYWLLPVLPGSLATVFATVTYFIPVSYTHLDVYKRQCGKPTSASKTMGRWRNAPDTEKVL